MTDPDSKQTLNSAHLQNQWVEAIGRVQFLPQAGGKGFATTLILPTDRSLDELVKMVKPPSNPYLN